VRYVVGPGGEQLTEVGASTSTWNHTNVYAGGKLIGTYDGNVGSPALHFHFDDPLGTRRAQASSSGVLEAVYQSLPFGDGYNSNSTVTDDPTENHFTGKERDTESGNDYMFARYYNSATGRFLSPDWSAKEDPVPYAKLDDPQTLNLYAYVGNNPVGRADADGHFWHELWNAATTWCGCWTADHAQAVAIRQQTDDEGARLMSQYHVTVQQDIVFPIGLEGLVGGAAASGTAAPAEGGTVTRYMGPGEAQTATETGEIPNTNAQGEPRPTHVTTDPPLDSASEAAQKYELPSETYPSRHSSGGPGARPWSCSRRKTDDERWRKSVCHSEQNTCKARGNYAAQSISI
jgi:RHS repeat-associated protein